MLTEDQNNRLTARLATAADHERRLSLDEARRIAAETHLTLRQVEWGALGVGIIPRRYERNIPVLGPGGQRRLLERRVAVVGLGGLGGCVVETLARLGVGRIVGVDPDVVTESNLNRQVLARVANLGEPKAAAAARRAREVNPAVDFEPRPRVFEEIDEPFGDGCEMVFDCLDRLAARRRLARRCDAVGALLVHGAIAGWCGQVAVCPPGAGLIEQLYAGRDEPPEARQAALPCTAAVTANLMVAAALPVLLGQAEPRPHLQLFDLQTGDWQTAEV